LIVPGVLVTKVLAGSHFLRIHNTVTNTIMITVALRVLPTSLVSIELCGHEPVKFSLPLDDQLSEQPACMALASYWSVSGGPGLSFIVTFTLLMALTA
jgi:hypothetical protein